MHVNKYIFIVFCPIIVFRDYWDYLKRNNSIRFERLNWFELSMNVFEQKT